MAVRLPRSDSNRDARLARISSRQSIVRHDIHSAAAGRETGQLAEARSDTGGAGFLGGLGNVLFGTKSMEIPEEVNRDRGQYIDEVKITLQSKEGMVPGQTYQEDLKTKMKALMKKSKEYRTMSGSDLLKLIEREKADESPFQGDRYDRLQMRISAQVKEVQIEKVTRKYDAAVFANMTGKAPSLSNARKPLPPAPVTHRPQGGMKRAPSTRREVIKNKPAGVGHERQRSIKFADEETKTMPSMSGVDGKDILTDVPLPSAPPPPGLLTRMFSSNSVGLVGKEGQSKS